MNEEEQTKLGSAEKVAFLTRAASYPDPTTAVDIVETHMSWVFVTDAFVYKMKKPVRLPYIDFGTLEARKHFCEESLRLNRRLAGDVYLGLVALTREADGCLKLDGRGTPVEWLEKMRRLPAVDMLDAAIGGGRVTEEDVRRFTRSLAAFYRQAEPVAMSSENYRARLRAKVQEDYQALYAYVNEFNGGELERICNVQRKILEREAHLFDARIDARKVIEAHGDLRPEHVCLAPPPVFIDCLEFNRDFREMDIADELSYLAMECEFAGATFIGPIIFETYAQETGDQIEVRLQLFYKSFRALLRAKLAAWHTRDRALEHHQKWLRRAADYIGLAEAYTDELEGLSGA